MGAAGTGDAVVAGAGVESVGVAGVVADALATKATFAAMGTKAGAVGTAGSGAGALTTEAVAAAALVRAGALAGGAG